MVEGLFDAHDHLKKRDINLLCYYGDCIKNIKKL